MNYPKIIKVNETQFHLLQINSKGEAVTQQLISDIYLNKLVSECLRAISPVVKAVNPKTRLGGI